MATELKVLTFNIWGLPDLITRTVYHQYYDAESDLPRPSRRDRMRALAARLSQYDIVMLQEAWVEEDRILIREISSASPNGLKFSHYYRSHAQGSGLLLLSRFPIRDVHFYTCSLNGTPLNIHHGDWYVGKGIAMATILHPNQHEIAVFFVHTIAEYNTPPNDEYKGHRLAQLWDLLQCVHRSRRKSLQIVAGDFNCLPDSVEYRMLTSPEKNLGNLIDTWRLVNGQQDEVVEGHTIVDVTVDGQMKRLDYVMCTPESLKDWSVEKVQVEMQAHPRGCSWPGRTCAEACDPKVALYSDHYGVAATFKYGGSSAEANERARQLSASIADPSLEIEMEIDASLTLIASRQRFHVVTAILAAISAASLTSAKYYYAWTPLVMVLVDVVEGSALLYASLVTALFIYWTIERNGVQRFRDEFAFFSSEPHCDILP